MFSKLIENNLTGAVGGVCLVTILTVLFAVLSRRGRKQPKRVMVPKLLAQLLTEFEPEPIVDGDDDAADDHPLEMRAHAGNIMNLARVNFHGLLDDSSVHQNAVDCIRTHGVGAYGPRGFYGTFDIHLQLEENLAKFMGLEEAVIYSYGFSTISSAIAAYCKRSDYIFCDEMISFAAQQGFVAAKSQVIYFRHNDMVDLEHKLIENQNLEAKKKKVFRKFLVVEGIYQRTGTICPLPHLMALRKKYMLRMFLDESISFGVLGKTGHGVTEHYDVDRSDVDMIMGSMEWSMASIGGFCVGASVIIEHQRLSGLGYCFSASLPPPLSSVAIQALKQFEKTPVMFKQLQYASTTVDTMLRSIAGIEVKSHPISPRKVFTVVGVEGSDRIKQFHKACSDKGLYLSFDESSLQHNVSVTMPVEILNNVHQCLTEALKMM